MFLALDAQYDDRRKTATVGVVIFKAWRDAKPRYEFTFSLANIAEYHPGMFYQRELPCFMAALDLLKYNRADDPSLLSGVFVDGYVDLGLEKPGLGRHLFTYLEGRVPVVGVAKTPYPGSDAVEVLRGLSTRPLYVTAAGMPVEEAATQVRGMWGRSRIPAMLQQADHLARKG